MHFKDVNPEVKQNVIENRTGFYDACGQGIFCNLGDGDVDFPTVRKILIENGFELIHKSAKPGADNKLIAFLHPKSTSGVLIEMCQEKSS